MMLKTTSELDHEAAMAKGSHELLEAINLARKGLNPGTTIYPVGLPRAYTERGTSADRDAEREKERKRLLKVPLPHRVRELREAGASHSEIAGILKTSHQKVTSMLHAQGLK